MPWERPKKWPKDKYICIYICTHTHTHIYIFIEKWLCMCLLWTHCDYVPIWHLPSASTWIKSWASAELRVRIRSETLCALGKLEEQVFRSSDIFRRFHVPNSCISSYLETLKSFMVMSAPCDWWWPSGDQQQTFVKCVQVCMHLPSPLSYPDTYPPLRFPLSSWGWHFREIWIPAPQAIVKG